MIADQFESKPWRDPCIWGGAMVGSEPVRPIVSMRDVRYGAPLTNLRGETVRSLGRVPSYLDDRVDAYLYMVDHGDQVSFHMEDGRNSFRDCDPLNIVAVKSSGDAT